MSVFFSVGLSQNKGYKVSNNVKISLPTLKPCLSDLDWTRTTFHRLFGELMSRTPETSIRNTRIILLLRYCVSVLKAFLIDKIDFSQIIKPLNLGWLYNRINVV